MDAELKVRYYKVIMLRSLFCIMEYALPYTTFYTRVLKKCHNYVIFRLNLFLALIISMKIVNVQYLPISCNCLSFCFPLS